MPAFSLGTAVVHNVTGDIVATLLYAFDDA